jgi:hypothetical protein
MSICARSYMFVNKSNPASMPVKAGGISSSASGVTAQSVHCQWQRDLL